MREIIRRLSRMPVLYSALTFEDIDDHFRWPISPYVRGSLVTALFLCRSMSGDDFNYITDLIAPDTMSGFNTGEEFEVCEVVVRLNCPIVVNDGVQKWSWKPDGYRKVTMLPEMEFLHDALIIIEEATTDTPGIRELVLYDEKRSIITLTPLFRVQL